MMLSLRTVFTERRDDRVYLPSSVLQKVHEEVPPYIFELKTLHTLSRHVGVIEFSAEEDTVGIPAWMGETLCLQLLDMVEVRLVPVMPKAEFIQFRPKQAGIEGLERETLQHLLGCFTILSTGDCIPITLPSGNPLVLEAISVIPSPAYLIDSEFKVDFLPAEEVPVEIEPQPMPATARYESGHRGVAVQSQMKCWTFTSKSATVYIGTMRAPSAKACDFVVFADGNLPIVRFIPEGTYYTTVVSEYPVDIQIENMKDPPLKSTGNCQHCNANVPEASLDLHQIRCTRTNWYCENCSKAYPKLLQHVHCGTCNDPVLNVLKHIDMCHKLTGCECKETMEVTHVSTHKRNDCVYRTGKCRWCKSDVRMADMESHVNSCGNKTQKCVYCPKNVVQHRLAVHMLVEHGKRKT